MNMFRAKVASTGLKSDMQHAQVSVILSSCILRINVYQRKINTNWIMLMKTFWRTYRFPWHPVWKSQMESSPFISRWKRGPDRKRGLARATQFTRGRVHTRTSLLTLRTSLPRVLFGQMWNPEERGSTGRSWQSKKPSSTPTLTWSTSGTRRQTTSTWWGRSPTSSWASWRAVAMSSASVGSRLPPGKQTSPDDLLSWTLKEQLPCGILILEPFVHTTNHLWNYFFVPDTNSHTCGSKWGRRPKQKQFYLNPLKRMGFENFPYFSLFSTCLQKMLCTQIQIYTDG